jgi:DNA-binding transcriptional LysR family regulator
MLSAYELTRLGVGVAIFPASVGNIAADGSVCIKKIEEPTVQASYVLIWNKERALPRVAQAFLKFVQSIQNIGYAKGEQKR